MNTVKVLRAALAADGVTWKLRYGQGDLVTTVTVTSDQGRMLKALRKGKQEAEGNFRIMREFNGAGECPTVLRGRFSDEQVRQWGERHGIDNSTLTDLRSAFEDARTLAPL